MRFLLVFLALILSTPLLAQEREDNGFLINLLEDQLSTETRTIRLSGVSGVLSSEARVARITISDPEGIWLQIDNARIVWSRSALLRGRVEVETLAAQRISIPRGPVAEEGGLPTAEPQPFRLPDLPVSVELGALDIERVVFGEALFGLAAEMAVEGGLTLAGGALDARFAMTRLDGPGGRLALTTAFDNADEVLRLDLDLEEPENGIVANALNLPDRPAVKLTLGGAGPLTALDLTLALDVAGQRTLDGTLTLDETAAAARRFEAAVAGDLLPLLPADAHPFFGGQTELVLQGEARADGNKILETLEIRTAVLDLAGSAALGPDNFPDRIALEGTLTDPSGARVLLPGGGTSLARADLSVAFGTAERWRAEIAATAVETGGLQIARAALDITGVLENRNDPDRRRIAADVTAALQGLDAEDPALADALGEAIRLTSSVAWRAGQPVELGPTEVAGKGLSVSTDGTFSDGVFDGRVRADIATLAPWSGIAGRDLAGAIAFSATGSVVPVARTFDLRLDGTARDLVLGTPALDGLMGGTTTLTGSLARTADGLAAEAFSIANAQAEITLDGRYATEATDLAFRAVLEDLAVVTDQAEGRARFDMRAESVGAAVRLVGRVGLPAGAVGGQALRNATLALDGTLDPDGRFVGGLDGTAQLGQERAALTADIDIGDELRLLRGLTFTLAETLATGTVGQGADGLLAGSLRITSPDLAKPAALAALDLRGAADLDLVLSRRAGQQHLAVTGDIADLATGDIRLATLTLAADIVDLFGVPLAAGEGALTGLALGGFGVDRATVIARRSDESLMDVTATARLALGTDIALAGSLESLAPGIRVALRTLSVEGFGQSARLTAPATITLEGPNIAASALAFDIGGGAVTLEGGRSDVWDVAVDIRALPLGIADLVVPDLAVTGTVSGAARITGPVATPDIDFNLSAETVGAAPLSALGLPPLSLVAEGRTDIATLQLDARLSGGSGLALLAAGAVPIGDGTLDLDIDLAALDLALLDQLAGGQGLSGRATGGAEISGTLAAPVAVFDLSAASVSARPLREAGIGPVAIAANGRFADDVLVLDTAEVNDAAARAGVQGRVDLAAERLDLTFNADMPLSLANPFVAAQSIQLGGQLTANGQVGGRFSAPEITGGIAVRSATIVDPLRNLRLDGVTLDARLTGREVLIDGLSGAFAAGGSVSANGRVALSPPLEAALNIQLSDVAYSNGETVSTVVSGTLGVNGALLSTPLVSGDIAIGRTEIAIPDSFGIREGVLLDLQHRGLPADTRLTLDRAGLLGGGELESRNTSRPAVRLDIQINAPNQIFVRGRGLDAEMGGGLRLLGTNADLAPQGQIDLIRGRVSLLGQRIDFTEGAVTATGDLNVRLRLIAETEVEDTDITLAIQGRARDPEFVLTSSPDLPQDEILALLIFRRELTSLSPLQVAQLASAAATLAGAGGGGLVSGFRNTAGLSNLDITTGEDGEIGVRAGAYISENVYLDLEAEADGDTRAIINIDITRDLKGRASFDNDGEGEIGIFFERDY